jgi:hypothetical protein
MRRRFMVTCTGLILAGAPAASAGPTPQPTRVGPIALVPSASTPTAGHVLIVAASLDALGRRSATFREMLTLLDSTPRIRVVVSPSRELRHLRGLIGLTRFVHAGRLVVASVEVHMDLENQMTLPLALAHEVAHVVEVACLGTLETASVLRDRLRHRAGLSGRAAAGAAIETAFAEAAGHTVVREMRSGGEQSSQLSTLAARHGLYACQRSIGEPASMAASQPALSPDRRALDQ